MKNRNLLLLSLLFASNQYAFGDITPDEQRERAWQRGHFITSNGACSYSRAVDANEYVRRYIETYKASHSGSSPTPAQILLFQTEMMVVQLGFDLNLCWEDLCHSQVTTYTYRDVYREVEIPVPGGGYFPITVYDHTVREAHSEDNATGGCYIHPAPDPQHLTPCNDPKNCFGWLGIVWY